MSDAAIRVENLSKQYRIGRARGKFKYKSLRDSVSNAMLAPIRRAGNVLRGEAYGAAELDETFWALKDVSFEIKRGEAVGVIGRNGAGKSTLLKILSEITEPSEGRVELHGRVGSLLEVGTGFHPELTGRDNIYLNGAILGMKRAEISRKFDEIVAFAEVEKFIDTPVKHYSSGMYVRLAFAVAAHLEPEILVVDEVLAVGDAAFQKKCLGKMGDVAKGGRTVLFVSHNMAAVQHLCKGALLLDKGQLVYSGHAAEAIEFYDRNVILGEQSKMHSPHVIFDLDPVQNLSRSDFEIVTIETFDSNGLPKPIVSTWDSVRFRISYWAKHTIQAGSAVLMISTQLGVPLLLCSTQPDSAIPMTIKAGYNVVECEFASLPLSAGEYMVGAGLAIPNKEWLCKRDQLGWLTVHLKDVFQSGMAPTVSRSILATPHVWRVD